MVAVYSYTIYPTIGMMPRGFCAWSCSYIQMYAICTPSDKVKNFIRCSYVAKGKGKRWGHLSTDDTFLVLFSEY